MVVFRGIYTLMKKIFVKKQNMTVRKNWKGNGECVTMKLQNTKKNNFGHMLANTSTHKTCINLTTPIKISAVV